MEYQGKREKKVNRRLGKVDSVKKAMEAAYRILSIRSRSEKELKEKLIRKGFEENVVNEVIHSLRDKGYLNDADFALNLAQYLSRTRNYGLIRIAEELRKKGIPSGIVRDTLIRLKGEIDEKEMVIHSLARKLRGNDYSGMDEKEKKNIVHYLYRKGFPLSTIYEVLKNKNWDGIGDDRE